MLSFLSLDVIVLSACLLLALIMILSIFAFIDRSKKHIVCDIEHNINYVTLKLTKNYLKPNRKYLLEIYCNNNKILSEYMVSIKDKAIGKYRLSTISRNDLLGSNSNESVNVKKDIVDIVIENHHLKDIFSNKK